MTRNTPAAADITTTRSSATVPEPPAGQVDAAVTRADRDGRAVFLIGTGPVPTGDSLGWLSAQTRLPRVYWRSPDGVELAGAGAACTIQASPGTPPFRAADEAIEILRNRTIRAVPPENALERFLGGFAFDPDREAASLWEAAGFVNARLVLPEALLVRRGPEQQLVLSLRVEPGSTPESVTEGWRDLNRSYAHGFAGLPSGTCTLVPKSPADDRDAWMNAVRTALDRIGTGTLHKVVLARQSCFATSGTCDATAIASALRRADAGCHHFAFQWTADTAFVGASPERLFRRDGPILRSDCLAGTARRGENGDTDHALADTLLASAKDRLEHSYVVEAILHDMETLCDHLDAIPEPRIVQFATLQHLFCPMTGQLRDGITVGDILRRLHPTPAVGGWPRADALTLIRNLETDTRGWYAGPVGWIGTEEAEFAVAIRSALAGPAEVIVFAGAGIVAGSVPELEWQETDDKLQAFVRAVNGRATRPR